MYDAVALLFECKQEAARKQAREYSVIKQNADSLLSVPTEHDRNKSKAVVLFIWFGCRRYQ